MPLPPAVLVALVPARDGTKRNGVPSGVHVMSLGAAVLPLGLVHLAGACTSQQWRQPMPMVAMVFKTIPVLKFNMKSKICTNLTVGYSMSLEFLFT